MESGGIKKRRRREVFSCEKPFSSPKGLPMKKTLLIGLFGFAAAVASYGQGNIIFDNYDSTPYMPVVYWVDHGALSGTGVASSSYHLDLLYTIGTAASASTDLGVSVPIDPAKTALGNAGYIDALALQIPGYVSGPCTFQIEAWQINGPFSSTYATSNDRGISAAFTEPSLTTGSTPGNFFSALPGPNGAALLHVDIVDPEPSVYALFIMSAACLMMMRRKKQV
jgi:hypothetical protein